MDWSTCANASMNLHGRYWAAVIGILKDHLNLHQVQPDDWKKCRRFHQISKFRPSLGQIPNFYTFRLFLKKETISSSTFQMFKCFCHSYSCSFQKKRSQANSLYSFLILSIPAPTLVSKSDKWNLVIYSCLFVLMQVPHCRLQKKIFFFFE